LVYIVDRAEEMLGSYGPQEEPFEKKFVPEETPSGMIARGHYNVKVNITKQTTKKGKKRTLVFFFFYKLSLCSDSCIDVFSNYPIFYIFILREKVSICG